LGEQLKSFEVSNVAKDMYHATLKLLIVLQHDFPDYVAANHLQLCESIPPHCTQLLNMVLVASPASSGKLPDPLQPGLKLDRMEQIHDAPSSGEDPARFLGQIGLLEILDEALQNGPSEDAIAQITHAINKTDGQQQRTTFGYVPVNANLKLVDAVTAYIGGFAVARSAQEKSERGPGPDTSDLSVLFMLVTELPPESRYYLLSSMVNQLRFANAHTHYFSQALLEIFGHDLSDPEETEIRQQIVRILLERLVGFWPQPWGLMVTIIELVKNDKYLFFELPFVKAAPEVRLWFEVSPRTRVSC
jgi:CCR4-NOT transcription complex subunit 1